MNFVSYSRLASDITGWACKLPEHDLIVAIPRSGLLPATMLGVLRNTRVTTVNEFVSGVTVGAGSKVPAREVKRVLVLDDSVSSGRSMAKALKRLWNFNKQCIYMPAAVYVVPEATKSVSFYCRRVSNPRLFEWNFIHHHYISSACVDMDGFLCMDPKRVDNDGDGPAYRRFIRTAAPLYIPTAKVGCIVTCRLSKYRSQTEDWLFNHGISYGGLIMMDYETAAARRHANVYAEFKAKALRSANFKWNGMPKFFVESDLVQARRINQLTKLCVLCVSNMTLFGGERNWEVTTRGDV